jgi:20S proteasome subunit alpha 5
MSLREAQVLVLRVLKQVMEEKLDQHNVQLAQVRTIHSGNVTCQGNIDIPHSQVTTDKGFHILDERALKEVIDAM